VSPDGFANHGKLKAHADAYLDKREMSVDELLGKIDNLIELGEAVDVGDFSLEEVIDDSPIPVEVESDSDFLIEDAAPFAAEQSEEFAEQGTQMSTMPADALLDKETDDAFAALTSGFGEELFESEATGTPAATPTATPEPTLAPVAAAVADEPVVSVEEPAAAEPEFALEAAMPDDAAPVLLQDVVEDVADVELEAVADIDVAIESLDVEEVDAPAAVAPRRAAPITAPPPAVEPRRAAPITAPPSEPSILVPKPATIPPPLATATPRTPTMPPPMLAPVTASGIVPVASPRAATVLEEAVAELPLRPKNTTGVRSFVNTPTVIDAAVAREPRATAAPSLDLGLDEVAADANREQSQVADRRSLKRTHDLEMRIRQLESEVQRASAHNEHESGTVQELVRMRQEVAAKEQEAKALRDRMLVLEHAKTAAETKNGQLEQRLFELMENDKASNQAEQRVVELEQALAAGAAQLAQLQAQRVADGAATASQAQQMLAEHHDALQAANAASQQHATALAQAQAALAEAQQQSQHYAAELAAAQQTHEQHQVALTGSAEAHQQALADAATAHAEIQQLREAHAALQASHVAALAEAQQAQRAEFERTAEQQAERLRAEHTQAIAALQQQLADVTSHHEAAQRAIAVHVADQTGLKQNHASELSKLQGLLSQHEDSGKDLRDQVAEAQQQSEQANQTIAALRGELSNKVAELQQAVSEAQSVAVGAQAAAVEHAVAAAAQAHAADREQALADAAKAHAAEQAHALADAAKAHAAEQAHALADAAKAHAADREQALAAAADRHTTDRERAVTDAVANAVAAQKAEAGKLLVEADQRHQAELQRAVAEAVEQVRTTASADLARVTVAAATETAELRAGLASARDRHKELDVKIALLQQQVATLQESQRTAATAAAEHSQRVEQLRSEIVTLESENTGYQEQVLKAYQKIKNDEALVARAKKAMAIALTVLDDTNKPAET
jgi:chromosome segregation ATPase